MARVGIIHYVNLMMIGVDIAQKVIITQVRIYMGIVQNTPKTMDISIILIVGNADLNPIGVWNVISY